MMSLRCQHGRSDQSGVGAELGEDNLRAVFMERPDLRTKMTVDPIQQEGPGVAQSPAEYDPRRVVGVLNVDAGDGEVQAGLVPDA